MWLFSIFLLFGPMTGIDAFVAISHIMPFRTEATIKILQSTRAASGSHLFAGRTVHEFVCSTALVAVDEIATPSSFDDAFQDQINFLDGPVLIMAGIFGVVLVLLAVLSFLSSKVDDAILQTLRDFEKTMRTYYPQRWKEIEAQLKVASNKNRPDAERDIRLLQIMEEIQEKEPEFMKVVRERMDF